MDKKRLNIVFLSRYQETIARGVETYVRELSSRLKKFHNVEVFSGEEADSWGSIKNGKFDLVIPTNGRLQSLKASLVRIFNGTKVLISGQAGVGRDDIWNILFTMPDVYVALTDFELNWAKRWAFKTRVVKIPNGVDLDKFNPKGSKIDLGLPHPIILSVGALYPNKHHEKIIKAMGNIEEGSLLIVGKGTERQKLQQMGETLLGKERFKIMNVEFEKMPYVYRSVDLFSLPSWDREAFGIVYVEALATNLGVVAPDDSPRREIVGNGGLFVDVNDDKKYAQAITEALKKDWKNIPRGQAEKFSWDSVADQYLKLIEEMFQ